MSSIGLSTWLLLGMVVVGVYVLPSVTAKFQGSHTMEFNATENGKTNASNMNCGACHGYIESELNQSADSPSAAVLEAHIGALNDRAYTNDDNDRLGGFLELGNITIVGTDTGSVCPLCHAAEIKITGSHTQVVTRVCTDADCHGYNNSADHGSATLVYQGQNVTQKLNGSQSVDVHGGWYSALEQINSNRPMANESEIAGSHTVNGKPSYGQGYLTCLACHTHFGMSMNITRPQSFNLLNMTISADGTLTINETGVEVNQTDVATTYSRKDAAVSVWTP